MAILGASFSDGASREVPESGRYLCTLVDVETFQLTSKNTGKTMPMFRWIFSTVKKTDTDGNPYQLTKITSTYYGSDDSWLTQLLDQMLGKRLTRNEWNALDVESLKAKAWAVSVTKTVNARGYDVAEIDAVREHVAETKPAPAPKAKPAPKPVVEDDIKDPFDEEEEDDLPFLK